MQISQIKKWKVTLPDGERLFLMQKEKPYIDAEIKTTITVDDEEYEYDESYDESDVDVEEVECIETEKKQYIENLAKQNLQEYICDDIDNIKYTITFNKEDLKSMIVATKDFMYQDKKRYNIYGIHFNFQQGKKIEIVATNSHCLAFAKLQNEVNFDEKIVIPSPIILEIYTHLENSNNQIKLQINNDASKACIDFGTHKIIFELLHYAFPDYEKFISINYNVLQKVSKASFLEALEKVSAISQNFEDGVLLSFKQGRLTLKVKSYVEELVEQIECVYGDDIDIILNIIYLKQCINLMRSESIILSMNTGNTPIKLQGNGSETPLYIIMPMSF